VGSVTEPEYTSCTGVGAGWGKRICRVGDRFEASILSGRLAGLLTFFQTINQFGILPLRQ
jgi:hypothetical protein